MDVNKDWTYKEALYFIDLVKEKYEDITRSFYVVKQKRTLFEKAYKIKKDIYALNFEDWRKDKLWEYINGDIEYIKLWEFI